MSEHCFRSQWLHFWSGSLVPRLEKHQKMVQVPPMWETGRESEEPGFSLVQPQLLQPFEEWTCGPKSTNLTGTKQEKLLTCRHSARWGITWGVLGRDHRMKEVRKNLENLIKTSHIVASRHLYLPLVVCQIRNQDQGIEQRWKTALPNGREGCEPTHTEHIRAAFGEQHTLHCANDHWDGRPQTHPCFHCLSDCVHGWAVILCALGPSPSQLIYFCSWGDQKLHHQT